MSVEEGIGPDAVGFAAAPSYTSTATGEDAAQASAQHAVQFLVNAEMDAAEIAEPSARPAIRMTDNVRQ